MPIYEVEDEKGLVQIPLNRNKGRVTETGK